MGKLLLPLLPKGSTYTGVDFSQNLINAGEEYFSETEYNITLLSDDFMKYNPVRQYDIVLSHAVLRHLNYPEKFLERMISSAKKDGLVICIDVNREIECDGLYIKGMDYAYLCSREGYHISMNNQLFNQTIDLFKKFEEVDAIVLGGSTASGKADLYSDFDVYVYLNSELSVEKRKNVLEQTYKYMELNNRYWETEDDCIMKNAILTFYSP